MNRRQQWKQKEDGEFVDALRMLELSQALGAVVGWSTNQRKESTEMMCPKCGAAMEAVVIEQVELDRCTACKGIWFDSGEDEKVKGQARKIDIGKPNPKGSERAKIGCPRCKSPMIAMVVLDQPHIHYESCGVCHGAFFDAGEFADAAEETLGDLWKRLKR